MGLPSGVETLSLGELVDVSVAVSTMSGPLLEGEGPEGEGSGREVRTDLWLYEEEWCC